MNEKCNETKFRKENSKEKVLEEGKEANKLNTIE